MFGQVIEVSLVSKGEQPDETAYCPELNLWDNEEPLVKFYLRGVHRKDYLTSSMLSGVLSQSSDENMRCSKHCTFEPSEVKAIQEWLKVVASDYLKSRPTYNGRRQYYSDGNSFLYLDAGGRWWHVQGSSFPLGCLAKALSWDTEPGSEFAVVEQSRQIITLMLVLDKTEESSVWFSDLASFFPD